MSQDNRPISIRHRRFDPRVAHGWVRYDNGWLTTTCGQALAPDEYEYLAEHSPITCVTCLVKDSRR
jgi:hypothetical protein